MIEKMSLSLSHNDSNSIDGDTFTRNTATTTKLTAAELNIIVKQQENATVRYFFYLWYLTIGVFELTP